MKVKHRKGRTLMQERCVGRRMKRAKDPGVVRETEGVKKGE